MPNTDVITISNMPVGRNWSMNNSESVESSSHIRNRVSHDSVSEGVQSQEAVKKLPKIERSSFCVSPLQKNQPVAYPGVINNASGLPGKRFKLEQLASAG